jgi:exopolysaccharide biosynthesis polyprenyl glycosylphosphotransferase
VSAVSHDAAVTPQSEIIRTETLVSGRVSGRRGWLMRRLLFAADLAGLVASYGLGMILVPPTGPSDTVVPAWEVVLFVASLPLWVLLFQMHGLYDRDEERTDHSTVDDFVDVLQALTLGAWLYLVVANVLGLPHPSLQRLVVFWLVAVGLIPLLRAVSRAIGRRRAAYVQNVIIVGSGAVAHLLADKIDKHPEYGLRVVGFVDRDNAVPTTNASRALIGTTDDLPRLVGELDVQRVIIAFSTDSHERTLHVIRSVQDSDVQVEIVPRMFEVLGTNAQLHTVEGLPLVGLPSAALSPSSRLFKRSFDLIVATVGLLLISPLLIAVAVAIRIDTRGPALFRQVRMGGDNRPFRVFKFRTMVVDAEANKPAVAHLNMHSGGDPRMFKVPDDPRVTRVGRFLRRWRIDELPQLLDVIRGRMSLVGPRPLILEGDQHVEDWARRRLDLKPGMTGLWQVLGASDIPFDEMTKLDYLYVTNWSLREDVRLMMLTLPALTRSRAAY